MRNAASITRRRRYSIEGDFMKWLLGPLRKTFDFGGRSNRTEFWMFALIYGIVQITLQTVEIMLWGVPALAFLLGLVFFLPSLSVTVRRLHDMGRSGWWALFCLTIIGAIIPLVFALAGSDPAANQYGPGPKRIKNRANVLKQKRTRGSSKGDKMKTTSYAAFGECHACGKRQMPGSKFCTQCGAPQEP